MKATNATAQAFKALHVPGKPLLLANVHDAPATRLVASLPSCRAIATASHSLAAAAGTEDNRLTLEIQLPVVAVIAAVARDAGKPLSVDLQDGYGSRLEEAVAAVVGLGAVGINLEDTEQASGKLLEEGVAVKRIQTAKAVAETEGLKDFVVNARSDAFLRGGNLDEAIRRGKLYLDAGADCIYIMGPGARECTRDEVARMVRELDGKVNVLLRLPHPGHHPAPELTAADLVGLGVARASTGPQIFLAAEEAVKAAARLAMDV